MIGTVESADRSLRRRSIASVRGPAGGPKRAPFVAALGAFAVLACSPAALAGGADPHADRTVAVVSAASAASAASATSATSPAGLASTARSASGGSTLPAPDLAGLPPAGPAVAIAVPPMQAARLSNGLSIVVIPRRGLPLLRLSLVINAGPEADPPGHAGLSELTAAVLLMGANRSGGPADATAIARAADALGGSLTTASSWRSSSLSIQVTTDRAESAAGLLADLVRRPLFAAEEIERARAVAIDSLKARLADPAELAAMVAGRAWWGDNAYGASQSPASLARIDRQDLLAFHRRWYRPDRALLVVAGDTDSQGGIGLARQFFGDWTHPADPPPSPPLAKAARPASAAGSKPTPIAVDLPASGQSAVVVAGPYVAGDAADRRIAEVADAVLGGGYSSRLNRELRIERGLAYGADSLAEALPGGGWINASAMTDHPNAAEVAQRIASIWSGIAADPPSADELAARKAMLVGRFARSMQTLSGLSNAAAGLWSRGRRISELRHRVDDIAAVTPDQVRQFAARHWADAGQRTVIVGDLARIAGLPSDTLRFEASQIDLDRADLLRRAPRAAAKASDPASH